MNQEQIARIAYYEGLFEEASAHPTAETLAVLEAYYTSGLWLEDYQADEAGELPRELKRGVLSQDGLFDLLERGENA